MAVEERLGHRAPLSARVGRPGLVAAFAVAVGVVGALAAWRVKGSSATSVSPLAAALVLAAGASLVFVGLEQLRRAGRERFGALLTAAGVTWLIADWANPAVGDAFLFSIGLLTGWLFPAVVVHALLSSRAGRGRLNAVERAVVAVGYVVFGGLLGLVQAITFDSASMGCALCPPTPLAVAPSTSIATGAVAVGGGLAAIWAIAAVAVLISGVTRATPAARRLRLPIVVPGTAFIVTVGLELGRAAGRSTIPKDALAHGLRLLEAAFLVATVGGVALEWVDARRSRQRIARVVAELRSAPGTGGLREALARTLRDPELQIAYPVDDRQVDAAGREILGGDVEAGRARTPIVRDGEVVATLDHRADVLDARATIDEVVRAARLGLEHERLQASIRSQLAAITAARKRIVATADDERRRLERDLHDGAQQHLIAISIRLRLLAGQVEGNQRAVGALSAAAQEIGLAIDDLRDVAHGIYPSILADEGLAAALEGLAEAATVPLLVDGVPSGRLLPAVEAAAYAVVAESLAGSRSSVRVDGRRESDDLVLTVVADVLPDDVLVDLSDRIGAADGRFDVRPEPESNRLVLTAVLPCAS